MLHVVCRSETDVECPGGMFFQHPSAHGLGVAGSCDGAALVTLNGTSVRAVCVVDKSSARRNMREGFFPLTIEYRERAHGAGIVPRTGTRREIPGKDHEVLVARMIDRALRPRVAEGFYYSTQIVATVESFDGSGDPEILALNACSAALHLANIPWRGPVGAVRAFFDTDNRAKDDDGSLSSSAAAIDFKHRSLRDQRDAIRTKFVLSVAAAGPDQVVMLEGGGRVAIPDQLLLEAVTGAAEHCAEIAHAQERLKKSKPKARDKDSDSESVFRYELILPNDLERQQAKTAAWDLATELSHEQNNVSKRQRTAAQTEFWVRAMRNYTSGNQQALGPNEMQLAQMAVHDVLRDALRNAALEPQSPSRPDGRAMDEVRPIKAAVGVLPCAHGSALFSRGDTQVLCSVTLGAPHQALIELPAIEQPRRKPVVLTYSFPPYSINRTGPLFGRNRRMVGHGALAEKALAASLTPVTTNSGSDCNPCDSPFPFVVNINTEVTGSDGSSSMASICAAALALMDASVPLTEGSCATTDIPVGVSIGLYVDQEDPTRFVLPVDILGMEDHYGDMDFKLAGNAQGTTALQLDIKRPEVPLEVLRGALRKAANARAHIVKEMVQQTGLRSPRVPRKASLPVFEVVHLEDLQLRMLLSRKAHLKRQIEAAHDASIDTHGNDSPTTIRLLVVAPNDQKLHSCVEAIFSETRHALGPKRDEAT